MKVLFSVSKAPVVDRLQVNGWATVLAACGHTVIAWDKQVKPTFDAFDELKPDLFICTPESIDRALKNVLKEYTGKSICLGKHPLNSLFTLSISRNQADGLFHSRLGANIVEFYPVKEYGKRPTDVCYIGNPDEATQAFLNSLDLNVKIFASQLCISDRFVGSPSDIAAVLRASKVVLVPGGEEGYCLHADAGACGCDSYSNDRHEADRLIKFVKGHSPQTFKSTVLNAIDFAYHPKVEQILIALGFTKEAQEVKEAYEKIRNSFE